MKAEVDKMFDYLKKTALRENFLAVLSHSVYHPGGNGLPGFSSKLRRCFSRCSSLTSIYVKSETPIFIFYNVFDSRLYNNATLFVPEGSFTAYKNAEGWKNFNNIREY